MLEPSEFAFDGAAALVELAPPVGARGTSGWMRLALIHREGGLAFSVEVAQLENPELAATETTELLDRALKSARCPRGDHGRAWGRLRQDLAP